MKLKFEKEVLELRAKGYTYKEIMEAFPISKSHISYICNPEVKKRQKANRLKHYYKDPEKMKARKRQWYQANREHVSKYHKENRAYFNSHQVSREALKRQGSRIFDTLENNIQIRNFFIVAKCLSILTKQEYEVDHIEPLQGKRSCGLHVPWNLQILTAEENKRKSNKFL